MEWQLHSEHHQSNDQPNAVTSRLLQRYTVLTRFQGVARPSSVSSTSIGSSTATPPCCSSRRSPSTNALMSRIICARAARCHELRTRHTSTKITAYQQEYMT